MFFFLKNSVVKLIAFLAICLVFPVWASHYTFDPALLVGNNINANTKTDLSLFEQGGQLPGTYLVDIFLGDEKIGMVTMAILAGIITIIRICARSVPMSQAGQLSTGMG